MKKKLFRMTTLPISMNIILKGQLEFMNRHFDVAGVTGHDDKHFNEIARREGIKMHSVHMTRTISILNDISALWKLYRLFRNERPQIVHTHTPKAGLLGMLAAWLARVPVRLHTVAGLPLLGVKGVKRKLLNQVEKITFRCAHKVYPNSRGLMEILMNEGLVRPEKMKVIANGGSNGINADFFTADYAGKNDDTRMNLRAQYGIQPETVVFSFVGRIAKEKGIQELVDAFAHLQKMELKVPLKLLLIGTFEKHYGVLETKLEKLIHDNPDILFLGRFDDVRPYYLMSDVYVFPSYREGFPNSLLEAGAMGLPCIATDINGCNEIVTHNENGILIPARQTTGLTNAMLKLIEDEPYRKSLAANARPAIVEKYRRELIWEEMLCEYNNFLQKNAT